MSISEEIRHIKNEKADWKKFGISVSILLAVIGLFLFWKRNDSYVYVFTAAAFFFIMGLIFPLVLKPIYQTWMILAVAIGFTVTRFLLTVIFYFVVFPVGCLAKIVGKKFLDLKMDRHVKSYWIQKDKTPRWKADYERQF
jgi:hypothetical protein